MADQVPTVGRIVHFYAGTSDKQWFAGSDQPLMAGITRVWGSSLVNLVIFDSYGASLGRTSVPLGNPCNGNSYWEWPPVV